MLCLLLFQHLSTIVYCDGVMHHIWNFWIENREGWKRKYFYREANICVVDKSQELLYITSNTNVTLSLVPEHF